MPSISDFGLRSRQRVAEAAAASRALVSFRCDERADLRLELGVDARQRSR
jgi:hypothetical protein